MNANNLLILRKKAHEVAACQLEATVLNSPRAVAVSLYIIRAFVKLREDLTANATILKRLAEIDKTLLIHASCQRRH